MNPEQFRFHLSSPSEIEERTKLSHRFIGASRSGRQPPRTNQKSLPAPLEISRELLEYLQSIYDTPELPVSKRDDRLGISRRRGAKYREQLLFVGLVRIDQERGGRGRPAVVLRVTEAGLKILAEQNPTDPE